jgi:hypothetical protein
MDTSNPVELTVDIVSAHVGHNRVAASGLPRLIQSVNDALAETRQPAPAAKQVLGPKGTVRASVIPDALICLDCGARLKMQKRHISTDHGLLPADSRTRGGGLRVTLRCLRLTMRESAARRPCRSVLAASPEGRATRETLADRAAVAEPADGE